MVQNTIIFHKLPLNVCNIKVQFKSSLLNYLLKLLRCTLYYKKCNYLNVCFLLHTVFKCNHFETYKKFEHINFLAII